MKNLELAKQTMAKVCDYYGVPTTAITESGRLTEPLSTVRCVAVHFLQAEGFSCADTAWHVGMLYGTNVHHNQSRILERMEVEPVLAADVTNIAGGRKSDATYATWLLEHRAEGKRRHADAQRTERVQKICGKITRISRALPDEAEDDNDDAPFERENGLPGFGSLKHLAGLLAGVGA